MLVRRQNVSVVNRHKLHSGAARRHLDEYVVRVAIHIEGAHVEHTYGIDQHTSAYVSIRQHTCRVLHIEHAHAKRTYGMQLCDISIREHTSAREHT